MPAGVPPLLPSGAIYLASQSARRVQLLAQIGVRCELLVAGDDEDSEALEAEIAGESPERYVVRVTRLKAEAALRRRLRRALPAAPILCADTTVAYGERILGKPVDAAAARAMLALLSGRGHRVLTAMAVVAAAGEAKEAQLALNVSQVRFAPISADQIDRYVASGEPFGKAGSYAIQSAAAAWIERIEGSYSGVMGLALYETAQLLRAAGVEV